MDRQKQQAVLDREEIKKLIKDLEPGTMLTLEMPESGDSSETKAERARID